MAESTGPKPPAQPPEVAGIARLVLAVAGVSIIAVSVIVLIGAAANGPKAFSDSSQMVFNALLPLMGSWVGTVIAYYFSRQNFESASQSVERLVTLTAEQKLGQIFVEKEMMRPAMITVYQIPDGKTAQDVPLKDIQARLGGKITRVPVVDKSYVVQYVVHQSGLYKFVAEQSAKGKGIDTLTLKDLVEDAEIKNWVVNIAYLSEKASVAEAKQRMEQQPGCQDLIVTRSGNKSEPMLGWMTNVDIGRLSRA